MKKQSKNVENFNRGGVKSEKQNNDSSVIREKDWYREKIVETVRQIEDTWILKAIHNFVLGMTKEGN